MRIWFGGIVAALTWLGVAAASAAMVDCGSTPSVKCLAMAIFSEARTLPADDFHRKHVAFAEKELAPGDIKVALDYVAADNPDPSPWEDIEWIARAGRFDRAIEIAKKRTSPVERLGGMLAVAAEMLDKNERVRARKIVEDVERELPSVPRDGTDQYAAAALPSLAGEVWAGLGIPDRVVRLVSGEGATSIDNLIAIASRYPAVAARLREQAWLEAERTNELHAWRQPLEGAINRGDKAEIADAVRRVERSIDGATDRSDPMWAIPLAELLLKAEATVPASKLIDAWQQWIEGKDESARFNTANALVPVLAGLKRDRDVEAAVGAVNGTFHRSGAFSRAADAYFRLGRQDIVRKLDAEAFAVADSAPTSDTRSRTERDSALHNLALARAGRGDIEGGLAAVDKLSDGVKVRQVTSYVVRRAIDTGHGQVAVPAIERLQQIAYIVHDVGLLLDAAKGWHAVGNASKSREAMSQALDMRAQDQVQLDFAQSSLAAELMWRIEGAGRPETMIDIVDRIGVTDPNAIDRLIEVISPLSPAIALELVGRQTEVTRRIDELANIAIRIAAKPN